MLVRKRLHHLVGRKCLTNHRPSVDDSAALKLQNHRGTQRICLAVPPGYRRRLTSLTVACRTVC